MIENAEQTRDELQHPETSAQLILQPAYHQKSSRQALTSKLHDGSVGTMLLA